MGTTFSVTVVGEFMSNQVKAELEVSIKDRLDKLDAMMSTYKPDSEVSRFNDWESSDWFGVSPDTAQVFQHAREVSEVTGGAFDVTVAPLVDVWGFGPVGPLHTLPSDSDINRLLGAVDFRQIEVNDVSTALRKTSIHVKTDVSAVAKGYAVDRVAEKLSSLGCKDYLVDIGGESFAKGQNQAGTPWKIGIEVPSPKRRGIQRVLALSDLAIATSGDYRNFRETAVGRVSHVMDPRTKLPVTSNIVSATVLHRSAMMADAYATSMMVLGYEDGMKLAEAQSFPVYLLLEESGGRLEERYNDQMIEYLELDND